MTDYISRETTIDAICRLCNANFEEDPCEPSECEMMSLLRKIPAADVRPVVKAKLVYTDMSRLVCSNCGNPVAFALKADRWHEGDFCPNCGAKMEES